MIADVGNRWGRKGIICQDEAKKRQEEVKNSPSHSEAELTANPEHVPKYIILSGETRKKQTNARFPQNLLWLYRVSSNPVVLGPIHSYTFQVLSNLLY